MVRCYRRGCKRKPEVGTLFFVSDGVDYIWSCQKHAPAARAAADLLGGEPVYDAFKWLRFAGPLGGVLRPFAKRRPPLLSPGVEINAAGSGYMLPLLDTMPMEFGTALALSAGRVLMIAGGQPIFNAPWSDIRSYAVGLASLSRDDEPRRFVQLRTGSEHMSYMLWVRPQDEDDWLRELTKHNVPQDRPESGRSDLDA